ncbi:prophage terminase small subunit [Weissella kandleri]|uniref:Prophage terminase small subunit n=1 Tax=Weissella kandleri TaxID=1616 RepID=A0A0R2JEC8_9LACO|nr:terminase small subunit [Weissella kandleri]KRN75665.1 prophage terminase small subunit [Weissella kandleri]
MTDKWEQAENDYLAGMKQKDIAAKYDVSLSAVKSWKSRKWGKEKVATKSKKVAKKVAAKSQKVATKNNVNDVIDELDEYGLTDKQNLFVVRYLKSFNATQAYMDAYKVDYNTANASGPRMLVNVSIQKAIKRIKAARFKDVAVDENDLIAQLAKQAFADIGDYVIIGSHDEYKTDENGNVLDVDGNPVIHHKSYVQLVPGDQVDTSLIKKVTVGKDGPIVELFDKTRAQEKLLDLLLGVDDAKVRKTITDANIAEAKLEQITAKQDDIETGLTNVMDLLMKGEDNDRDA